MGAIAVAYTVLGGLKAVIYTDTIQWIVLMVGLIVVAIPLCYHAVGGIEAIKNTLPASFFSFSNVSWQKILNWMITIVPIWFIGMTLYQRIYASRSVKTAKRAWFIAGLFEYPLMAFMGVVLGLFARVAYENGLLSSEGFAPGSPIDAEMGLPLLLKSVLPVGLTGIVMSAYFSAIMSTADSCLMASSGNILTDIMKSHYHPSGLRLSQLLTLLVGVLALFIALKMPNVLQLMLYSYTFMVSGLFVPVIAALLRTKNNPSAAFWAMIAGGATSLTLIILSPSLPFGLDPIVFGIMASLVVFLFFVAVRRRR